MPPRLREQLVRDRARNGGLRSIQKGSPKAGDRTSSIPDGNPVSPTASGLSLTHTHSLSLSLSDDILDGQIDRAREREREIDR